jgi:AAA+ superfamily predicted ATPase
MEPFADSVAHLLRELKRVDLMLKRMVIRTRRFRSEEVPEEFRGIVVPDSHVEDWLNGGGFISDAWKTDDETRKSLDPIDRELERHRSEIDESLAATEKSGRRLTLPHLAQAFGLSQAEVDLLLIALAPELEPRYELLYAYVQNDYLRKRPSVDLALNLVCHTPDEKVQARRFVAPGAPLVYFGILELSDEPSDRRPTLLRRFLKIDETVIRFLLEQPSHSFAIGSLVFAETKLDKLEVSESTKVQLANLVQSLEREGVDNTMLHFSADAAAAARGAASAVADALNRTLLLADLPALGTEQARASALIRDSVLSDSILGITAPPDAENEAERTVQLRAETSLWDAVKTSTAPLVLLGSPSSFPHIPCERRLYRIAVEPPDYTMRAQLWEETLPGVLSPSDALRLADTFSFGGDRIRQTAALAYSIAALRNASEPLVTTADVLEAGRQLTTPQLGRFAIAVQPRYGWDDIVLPPDTKRQLKGVAARLRQRPTVMRDWGFEQRLSRGKGVAVLFTGVSGTGKSMAAEVLAYELSLHLFQIDLSTVVSKYIGETEKNLSAIFAEAELSQSLLFFDEADSLYGKRTEVKDAHDRYANIEVNFLLQRIEQYEGLVVLATNFQKNLDDAFLRRLHDVIEFPFPDEQNREEIWRRHIPPQAPVSPDIDWSFLARQFQLTGGNIKNVVLSSAFLAAEESSPIRMDHLIACVRTEFQKQGRLVMRSDLGPYAPELQRGLM